MFTINHHNTNSVFFVIEINPSERINNYGGRYQTGLKKKVGYYNPQGREGGSVERTTLRML